MPDFERLTMRDIIFISLENWDGVWRRNQFLCSEWLRRFPEMRLLFVGRSKDLSHAVRSTSAAGLRRPTFQKSAEFKGLTFLNPFKFLPNSLSPCRQFNLSLLALQIRSAARKAGLRSPLLWINDHCAAPLAGQLNERAVVYDITDDWTLMPAVGEKERAHIRASDASLCAKADLVVVCSNALERSRRGLCRKIITVPNGVDAAHYRPCLTASPDQMSAPVFGYVGTLHGDRLDLDLIGDLARAKPEAKVVLCGPDLLTVAERKKLLAESNVQLMEQVHYADVPRIIAGFDVCILPHRCTPFTESLNPIKLWEYLASGKPVAATPVAGFRERAHLCHLGLGRDGFLAACSEALREDGSRSPARIREAESNSWKARSEQLLEAFRQMGWLGRPIPRPRRARAGGSGDGGGQKTTDSTKRSMEGERVWGGQASLCEILL